MEGDTDLEPSSSKGSTKVAVGKTKMWGNFLDSESSEESQEMEIEKEERQFSFSWPSSSTSPRSGPSPHRQTVTTKPCELPLNEEEKENQCKNLQSPVTKPEQETRIAKAKKKKVVIELNDKPKQGTTTDTKKKELTIYAPFDEANVKKWSVARIKTWKERHSNPNAFYYRFTGTNLLPFEFFRH